MMMMDMPPPAEPAPVEPEWATAARELEEDNMLAGDVAFTPPQPMAVGPQLGFGSAALTTTPPFVRRREETEAQFYGLPPAAAMLYRQRGVRKLYDWQDHVLTREDVVAGGNFVYSLPTSGGKTLVAEVLLMRAVLLRRTSAFFVLPYVSVAEEKLFAMQAFAEALGFQALGYYGTSGRFPAPVSPTIYVCTIEKANSLLNHFLEEGRPQDIGCVVVDELHMVGEGRRGATLELLLTKTLRACGRKTQVVGMSATVPNLETLARWLQASCYVCDFRPVPLKQHVVVGGAVLLDDVEVRALPTAGPSLAAATRLPPETEHVMHLVQEVAPEHSVLVFCASRAQCVEFARIATRWVTARESTFRRQGGLAAVQELKSFDKYEAALAETIPHGVAYHHGGLLMEERELIERAYRNKAVTVLCCTSTLAAGVNLPARRVVFRTPYIGRDFLTKSRYQQMCGRAGRAGLDDCGESFLLLTHRDRRRGFDLLRSPLEPTVSQVLTGEPYCLARILLECFCTGVCGSRASAHRFASTLLLRHTGEHVLRKVPLTSDNTGAVGAQPQPEAAVPEPPPQPTPQGFSTATAMANGAAAGAPAEACDGAELKTLLRRHVDEAVDCLIHHKLLVEEDVAADPEPATARAPPTAPAVVGASAGEALLAAVSASHESLRSASGDGPAVRSVMRPSPFGASSVRSCFSIPDAVHVRDELVRLQETGLVLCDDLHVCYFLTPLADLGECDWRCYQDLLTRLPPHRQRIAELLGVDEWLIDQRACGLGGGVQRDGTLSRPLFVAKRFFVAMMLCELLGEVPAHEVEAKYLVNRGQVQSLMRNAALFSSSITTFCAAMEWFSLEAVLASFVKRLGYGVKPDIVPLMEIRGVQASRARMLWHAGYKNIKAVAVETPEALLQKVKSANSSVKSVKFFTIRSAASVVREANVLLQTQLREKQTELIELSARSSAATPPR